MNYTGYSVLKIPKTGAAFAYAKEARDFATGATGVGGYLNADATASGWTDVRFVSAILEGSSSLPVSIGATYTDLYTGVSTVIGGSTPIGDLRSEDGPYVGVGNSSVYYTKKGQEYGAAFYATYIGGTNSSPTKIGIGTTSTDISISGYYEGAFTTRNIYEFESSYNADLDDPTKIITGSGVYTNGGDVSLQFNILNRNGELLTSASQIASDPFVDRQIISILDSNANVVFPNYRTNGDSTFTFSRSQNIDVFGSYNRNFGIRNEIVNKDGGITTGEFYLYANTATFDGVIVQASGETSLNQNLSNHSPPNTGTITSAVDRADAIKYFNDQPINTSGSTGFIELTLNFNESPNFTNLGDVTIWKGASEDFVTNRGSLVGNYPLNLIQEGQKITLTANDGIEEATPLFFKLIADSDVGFEPEILTIGPYTLEPNVEGPDFNLYNQGDQSLVGDFTIEGGLEGDSSNGGNLNVSGNALGTGIGGRLTGPESKMYLLSGDAGTESDTLQSVTARGNTTDQGIEVTAGGICVNDYLKHCGDTDTYLGFPSNDNFELYTAGGSALAIDPSQNIYFRKNVGIGSNGSSSQKLFVEGNSVQVEIATSDGYSIRSAQKADISISGTILSSGSMIAGGSGHLISGDYDTIAGGTINTIAGGNFNFIGGGSQIDITGSQYSSSVGGKNNDLFNSDYSVIGGGQNNKIEESNGSFIGGGFDNLNQADFSAIGGGTLNKTTGNGYSFIGGGEGNEVHSVFGGILAGENNIVSGDDSAIVGSSESKVFGTHSLIAGGKDSVSSGDYSFTLGRQALIPSSYDGAAVFADGQGRDHISSGAHTATLDFAGGVYVPTSGMFGEGLFVSGVPVLTGEINPPEVDTLQTVTTRGNVTTTSIKAAHISGSNLTLGNGVTDASIKLDGDFGGGDLTLQNLGSNQDILFKVNDGGVTTTPFTIQGSTSNIGIGTFSPTETLTVDGNIKIANTDKSIIGYSATENIRFYNPTNEIILSAATAVRFATDLRMQGNQSVLNNAGDQYWQFFDQDYDGFARSLRFNVPIVVETSEQPILTSRTNLEFRIDSNNDSTSSKFFVTRNTGEANVDELFTIKEDGNVGIGTTNPSEELDVIGDVKANRYTVEDGASAISRNGSFLRIYSNGGTDFSTWIGGYHETLSLRKSATDGLVGINDTTPSYQLDVNGTGHFVNDLIIDGSTLGAGDGNRITNNGVPYLLSGDSPAETQTLQDVCDNGDETTTSIFSTGPYISGVTGLFNKEFHVGDLGSNSHAFNFEKGNGLYDTNIVLKPFGNPGGFNSSYWMTVSKQAYSGFITNGNNSDFYIGHDLNKTALKLEYDGGGVSTFSTSNTDINFEDGTLFVDESTQRVGVGTTAPNVPFEIKGSVGSNLFGINTTTHGNFRIGPALANSRNAIKVSTDNSSLDLKFISSSERIYFGGNGDDQKVGVNTASPSSTLEVVGHTISISTTGIVGKGLHLGDSYGALGLFGSSDVGTHYNPESITVSAGNRNTTNSAYIDIYSRYGSTADSFGDINLNAGYYSAGNMEGDISLYTSGQNRLIAKHNGNVGIGTTSPSSALEVRGGNIDIGTNDIEGAANCKIEMDAADGFTLTNPNNAHGVDIVADDLTFFGGGLGTRKITTNAGDLSIDPTADLLLNENGGNVGIGTNNPQADLHVSGSGIFGIIGSNTPNSTVTVAGYDDFGLDFRAHNTWTHWKARVGHGRNFELYNDGSNNQNQVLELGDITKNNAKVYVRSTGAFIEAGMNASTSVPVVSMGCLPDNNHLGGAYLDVRDAVASTHRYEFNRDGTFVASGVSVSGDVLGTGDGNRITNNGVPYLLSGDSPAETQTLQDVCDNGNTTTTSIISTGPYISGVTGILDVIQATGDLTLQPLGSDGNGGKLILDGDSYATALQIENYGSIIWGASTYNFGLSSTYWQWKSWSKPIHVVGGAGTVMYIGTPAGDGNVGIGTVDPRAALHVDNGAGATTGFLVENSSNKNILWAEDNESINARSTFNIYHTTNASRYLKLGWGSIFANDDGNELTLGSNYSSNSATRIFVAAESADNTPSDTIQMQANRGLAVFSGVSTDTFEPTALIDVRGDAYISGSVEGTGAGNRITNNGVPYLLSGDSPAETQTLQDVTDNGNTTTNAITVGAFSATGTASISGVLSIPSGQAVASEDVHYIVKLTQAEYDALTPDASTMYIITDEDFNSPVINPIKTVASNYTITDTDYTILVSGSSTVNITLPSATINSNYVYNIKNITTNSVVVTPSAGYIDGDISKTINQKFESIATQSDGSNWYII